MYYEVVCVDNAVCIARFLSENVARYFALNLSVMKRHQYKWWDRDNHHGIA